jgi:GR25 family glycosyltransferase involved in LPS biosynthesis
MDNIDKCFVINLDRCIERRSYMDKLLSKLSIKYERESAIDGNTINENEVCKSSIPPIYWNKYALGLVKTFNNIIEKSIKNKYNNIVIFEDDIVFEDDFHNKFKDYYNQLPEDWGIVYFSVGNFHEPAKIEYHDKNIAKIEGALGSYALLINCSMFKHILEHSKLENHPLDNILIDIQMKYHNSYMFYPGLIKPLDNIKSTINNNICNYNKSFDYIYPPCVKNVMDKK